MLFHFSLISVKVKVITVHLTVTMKKLITLLCCLWLPNIAGAGECNSLDAVDWMLGEWIASPKGVVIHEHWNRVSEVTFEGESTTKSAADGEVLNYESLRLVTMSGDVFYIPKVSHNEMPVPFRLIKCAAGYAVFEILKHDAPQRLTYRLLEVSEPGDPDMEVRVEGGDMEGFSLFFTKK